MTLRILYALAGLVLGYGAVHGIALYNLVFDIGLALLALAAAVGFNAERSLRGAWPALLVFCGFFAWLDVQTLGLPDCSDATSGAACLARPTARIEAVAAALGVGVALAFAVVDFVGERRRRQLVA